MPLTPPPFGGPVAGPAPRLTRGLKLAFGVGSTAESVVITSSSGLIMLFYNQVRGEPAALVGLAMSAALFVNAVSDPLIGFWSDRTRSRLGRRHPFMFASILPTALFFYAVFNPPAQLGGTALIVWLALCNILLLVSLTLFHTPHLAFGGELSDNYLERTNVMNYNTFFLWIGDTLSWLLSFAWFFRAAPGYSNGALNPVPWPRFALAISAVVLVVLSVSSWCTRTRIPFLPQPAPDAARASPGEFVRDVLRALSNRSYLALLIGFFFVSLMSGVRGGLWLYGATFFWRLTTAQVSFFVIGSFVGYVFGALVVTRLHKRFDKRWTGIAALLVYSVGPAIPLGLGYLGILTPQTPGLLVILIAVSVLQHAPYSIMTTTIYSALADIADENELRYGIRQEGILFSTRTLFAKFDQAIGAALTGFVLTLISFPAKATPGQVSQPVLLGLAAAFVISTIPGLVAALFYAQLGVSRETHAATQAVLASRRAMARAEILPEPEPLATLAAPAPSAAP